MIVTSKNEAWRWEMWKFLHLREVNIPRSEEFQAIGRLKGDMSALIGVICYNGFVGRTCHMHAAGDTNWMSREYLRAMFDYPFRQLDMARVFITIKASNARSLKLNYHLGFVDFARIEDGWARGDDLVIMSMTRDQCRWIDKSKEPERTAA